MSAERPRTWSEEAPESRAGGADAYGAVTEAEVLKRLEAVHRMRVLLSLMLLPPLVFFIFLVVWAHEGLILLPIGAGLYLYMLIQFFVVQNPARRARRRGSKP